MNPEEILKKLKLDSKKTCLIINAPKEYQNIILDLQYDKIYDETKKSSYDFIQVFSSSMTELENLLSNIKNAGKYDCLFWICYPKGGSKIKSNLKRDLIWQAFSIVNLRPVSQIAIDETWSALRGRPSEVVSKKYNLL